MINLGLEHSEVVHLCFGGFWQPSSRFRRRELLLHIVQPAEPLIHLASDGVDFSFGLKFFLYIFCVLNKFRIYRVHSVAQRIQSVVKIFPLPVHRVDLLRSI